MDDKTVTDESAEHPEGVEVDQASVVPEGVVEDAAGEVAPEANVAEASQAADSAESDAGGSGEAEAVADEPEEELNELGFSAAELVTDDDEDEEDEDEDASPIEEFVEEVVVADDDADAEMEWYILKVQVNREKSICEALQRRVRVAGLDSYFGDILVPTEDVREFSKSGKQRIVKRKLYPGYIVVKMLINDDSWFLVRETPGIGDFTGAAGKPAPLSPEEISRIISTTKPEEEEDGEETIKTSIRFKVGDRVRVKEGYFQNYEGEVSTIDERNGRITVMINIFGRLNPVELDHWHVEDL